MSEPKIYCGHWPKNVSKTAKYSVRRVNGEWKVTVIHDLGQSQHYLAVEQDRDDIVERVNRIKREIGENEGGVFYINEYHHLIVPVHDRYYCAGEVSDVGFNFEFRGEQLTTKPVDRNGQLLKPGDLWWGPRPGIPYVLAAGGRDIYFDSPVVERGELQEGVTRRVRLSKVPSGGATRFADMVRAQRDSRGGRFYVNEHCAAFTPVTKDNGLDYVYCGRICLSAWFPESCKERWKLPISARWLVWAGRQVLGHQTTIRALLLVGSEGIPEDPQKAFKIYLRAAEQGDACAQNNLGMMLCVGVGIPANHQEAVKWLKLAAEQGVEPAQFILGVMCHLGLGTSKNSQEAFEWLRKAADRGHKGAVELLNRLLGGEEAPDDLLVAKEKILCESENVTCNCPGCSV